MADGTIRPVVAKAFAFDRAPDAHQFISERRGVGKVVLTPRPERGTTRKRRNAQLPEADRRIAEGIGPDGPRRPIRRVADLAKPGAAGVGVIVSCERPTAMRSEHSAAVAGRRSFC